MPRCSRGPLGESDAGPPVNATQRHPRPIFVLRSGVLGGARRAGQFLLISLALVAGEAAAQGELGGPLTPPPPVVLECWSDVRLFENFSAGTVDYCRAHRRYVPGALECYHLFDRVCSVYLPATAEWTELRQPQSRLPFPCPPGPETPVCRRLGWE